MWYFISLVIYNQLWLKYPHFWLLLEVILYFNGVLFTARSRTKIAYYLKLKMIVCYIEKWLLRFYRSDLFRNTFVTLLQKTLIRHKKYLT